MTDTRKKYAEAHRAYTLGLLVLGLVFSPVAFVLSRPFGGVSVSLAAVVSAICIALAWLSWVKESRRRRMSAVTQPTH